MTRAVGAVQAVTPLGGGSMDGAFRVRAGKGTFHLRVYRGPDRAGAERQHAAIALAANVPAPCGSLQTAWAEPGLS